MRRYALLALVPCLLLAVSGTARAEEPFEAQPEAARLLETMMETLRKARSLTLESAYRWEAQGNELGRCVYRLWLAKPNQFRMETTTSRGRPGGTLVGDGESLWIYWPGDRPHFSTERRSAWQKTRRHVYIRRPTPPGVHSIAHETGKLGAGMSMCVLDHSVFHGYTDSLERYIDGVMKRGEEEIDGEICDIIEVSYMKRQRSRYYWLSREDHLPRKLRSVVRVSHDIITEERWTNVRVNPAIEPEMFRWRPPDGWRRWSMPDHRDMLLKRGQRAPDFELDLLGGKTQRLSDLRGHVVWLVFWRAG